VEFESKKIEMIEDEIGHELGFSVSSQRVQLFGRCEELKRLGACKKRRG
jgi:Fe2+ or Zn2+ uptake regulation protein